MQYYKVWVATQRFHGSEPLTYMSDQLLQNGQIVLVQMRAKNETGIIVGRTTKPKFTAKPIVKVLVSKPLPAASVKLLAWIMQYYPAPSGIIVGLFLPSSLLTKHTNETEVAKQQPAESVLPELTQEQTRALETIAHAYPKTILLHGNTGSGKTRVYIELLRKTMQSGKQALVLTPEIGLTSPLVDQLKRHIDAPVVVIHSNLTEKARRDVWLQVLTSEKPLVVVGPRSALFSPFNNLGLIVIDEAHDGAYKQDQAPYYQAVRVAGKLAESQQAQMILGTATPTIQDYYIAKAKNLEVVRMQQQAKQKDAKPPEITVVNSREREHFTKNPYLSNQLLSLIESALEKNEQSLVFLNRRGTARLIVCQSCGWQALCRNCDLPLTYHGDKHTMQCHTCGFSETAITSCPSCHGAEIVFKSIGTKALTEGLQHLFPEAVVKRFDTDTIKDERFEKQYQDVADGKVDILVGTQMLIKGHDLPKLSVVGVVAADSSLYFPDYTAEEQTYQLISQVIGRVGRGHRDGSVVIQTINPENRTLQAALKGDWDSYYAAQLAEREQYGFPPFVQVLKLSCARASSSAAQTAANKLMIHLRELNLPVQLLGPSPKFIEKSQNKYRWQIIIKSKSRSPLLTIIQQLPANWIHDIDPSNLL